MNDYFAAEALILERLSSQIPAFRLVQGARDFAGVLEQTGVSPAIHLVYDGQEVRMGAGSAQAVDQLWLVVVAVKNVREATNGLGERQEAGPLLIQTCQALLGWRPGEDHGPMRMVSASGASFAQGVAFFPLRFSTRVMLQGA